MTPIQALTPAQIELLVLLAFEHVAVSQATMLRSLPGSWGRDDLQEVLAELVEEGWVQQISSGWGVPPPLQERVARYAWRNLSLDLPAASGEPGAKNEGELRRALYGGDARRFSLHWKFRQADFWSPFDPEWLDWLVPEIATLVVGRRVLSGGPLSADELGYLESRPHLLGPAAGREVAWASLMAGRMVSLDAAHAGFAHMQRGQAAEAARLYAGAGPDSGPVGWLELLALMEARPWLEVEKWLKRRKEPVLLALGQLGRGETPASLVWRPGQGLQGLLVALLLAWQGLTLPQWEQEARRCQAIGQDWLAAEYLSFLGSDKEHQRLGTRTLLAVLQPLAPWELALEALENLRQPTSDLRMVWKVEVYREGESLTLQPIEQKRGPKGWSAGRPVALKKLAQDWRGRDYLSESDRAICQCIGQHTSIEVSQAAPHLVGHPLVVHGESGQPLTVRAVRPRLQVSRRSDGWWVTISLPPRYRLEQGQLEILSCNAAEQTLQKALGEGLLFPPAGQARLIDLLRQLDISNFNM